ncbi:pyridoxal phosphate-dependent aminotransferase [Nannocystis pusilla]|uniref:pyridoxal phosphate-dependent aminotransferase n=1 Tax=Nannocystis pusilla TaxID=889268 RepID=UPI003DA5C25D
MRAIDAVEASATVAIADAAAARRADGEPVIDLSAGRAPEPTPAFIVQAAAAAMLAGHTHQAPARGVPSYLHVIAERLLRVHGLRVNPASEVVATAGCKQGLMLALLAVLERGAEVIVEDPCFVSYAPTVSLLGGTPVRVAVDPARRWCMNEEALAAAIGRKTRAIIVCSPHNPAGVVHAPADLGPLARLARAHDCIVIADEVYESVAWGGRRHTAIASLPGMRERTIGLMSLTKSHAMGGWRIGHAYGPEHLIARMVKAQQHLSTCASSIAQHAASAALEAAGEARMKELWATWERRVVGFGRDLSNIPGLRVEPVEAGFYAWVDVRGTGLGGDEFCRRLLREEQVAAVPGSAFGPRSAGYVRFTAVKDEDELAEALRRIDRFVRWL